MIDWAGVGQGALWVLGLAVILAALGRGQWLAQRQGVRWRVALYAPRVQMACDAGLLLCAGLFFSARATWERVAWAALAALYTTLAIQEWRHARHQTRSIAPCGRPANADPSICHAFVLASQARAEPSPSGEASRPNRLARIATVLHRLELPVVLAAVPLLVFPGRWSPWALAGIAALGLLRWASSGRLTRRSPVDLPLLLLLCTLPVTCWASADHATTLPALYQLLAGLALCNAMLNWATTPQRLWSAAAVLALCGLGLAALAPLSATNWGVKFLNVPQLLARLRWPGKALWSESISPNVLGGGLALT
jgi:hypothetical protein